MALQASDATTLVPGRNREILLWVSLFLLAIIPYLPAVNGEYVWDDMPWLVKNPAVHARNGLYAIWDPHYHGTNYYPLTLTLFWLEYRFWELARPGYHLVNMIFHASSAIVVWRFLKKLRLEAAWLIALIWAIHPVQVESVAWVTELKNTLSGFLYFLSALAYLRFERIGDPPESCRKWSAYVWSLVAFVCALLAKSAVCVLPGVLAVAIWWRSPSRPLRSLIWHLAPLLPMLIAGVGFAAFTAHQEHVDIIASVHEQLDFTWMQRCIIAGKDICFYVERLLIPYPLMPMYPKWNIETDQIVNFLPLVGVIITTIVLTVGIRKLGRGPVAGFATFVIILAPTLGFINFSTMVLCYVEDHFQYLACLGMIALVVEPLAQSFAVWPRYWAAIAVIYLAILTPLTLRQASIYQTNVSLWCWNVSHNPLAYGAQHNLATSLYLVGRKKEAYVHLNAALKIAPADTELLRSAGQFALVEKRFDDALIFFRRGINSRPDYGLMYTFTGDTYRAMGDFQTALSYYEKGCVIAPSEPDCMYPYLRALLDAYRLGDAEAIYRRLIKIIPGNLIVRTNFANLLLDEGKLEQAIIEYRYVLKFQLDNPIVWDNLAAACYQAGRIADAQAAKMRARELDRGITQHNNARSESTYPSTLR